MALHFSSTPGFALSVALEQTGYAMCEAGPFRTIVRTSVYDEFSGTTYWKPAGFGQGLGCYQLEEIAEKVAELTGQKIEDQGWKSITAAEERQLTIF